MNIISFYNEHTYFRLEKKVTLKCHEQNNKTGKSEIPQNNTKIISPKKC